jgi:hypothetical protein
MRLARASATPRSTSRTSPQPYRSGMPPSLLTSKANIGIGAREPARRGINTSLSTLRQPDAALDSKAKLSAEAIGWGKHPNCAVPVEASNLGT